MKVGSIVHGRLVLPEGCISGELEIVDGKIARIIRGTRHAPPAEHAPPTAGQAWSAAGRYVIPGLIDLHVQGFAGIDLVHPAADAVPFMARAMLTVGTTSYLATLGYSAPVLEGILPWVGTNVDGAQMLGVYFEGPFINPKRLGAIPAIYCLKPDPAELDAILDRARGRLKIMTVAPELDGSAALIKMLCSAGVTPAIGHTLCTYAQAMRGIDTGIRHATHLFNAMTGLSHREPGAAGAALFTRHVTVELIADGVHIHPAVISMAISLKGHEKAAAITDASPAAGISAAGPLTLLGAKVDIVDGATRLADGTLAGSILTPIQALKNLVNLSGIPLHVAVCMLTSTPAEIIGVERTKGSIAQGKDADLAIIDDDLDVHAVFVQGRLLWQKAPVQAEFPAPHPRIS